MGERSDEWDEIKIGGEAWPPRVTFTVTRREGEPMPELPRVVPVWVPGRTFVSTIGSVPRGCVVVTESGRMLEVGDAIAKTDGRLMLISDHTWTPLVHEAFHDAPALVFSVLLPLASALFGWLS